MRVRLATDRAVRSIIKTFNPISRPRRGSELVSSGAAVHPRLNDVFLLTVALIFFVQSIYSLTVGARYYPQKQWNRRAGTSGSILAVLACSDSVLLRESLASLPSAGLRVSVALPALLRTDAPADSIVSTIDGAWSHTAALNLAAARAPAHWLLLLPCGCASPRVPPALADKPMFYTQTAEIDGTFALEEGSVCAHTILVRKKDLFAVRASDERVVALTDPSLRTRLVQAGFRSHASLRAPPHAAVFSVDAAVQLAADALLERTAPPWTTRGIAVADSGADLDPYEATIARRNALASRMAHRASSYVLLRGRIFRVHIAALPLSRLHRSSGDGEGSAVTNARSLAVRRVLRARYAVPLALTVGMKPTELRRLLTALAASETTNNANARMRIVAVQPAHGLGNRLRAVGSARAFARSTHRLLLVVWERDAHCGARWDALFDPIHDVFVTSSAPAWPSGAPDKRADPAWHAWRAFDYMAPDDKDAPVDANEDEHVLFRSAYVLRAAQPRAATWAATNAEMRSLTPSAFVARLVDADTPVAGAVSVHVRARALDGEVQGATYGANGTALLKYWRKKSDVGAFVREMARMHVADPATSFIAAADCESARVALRAAPGSHVLPGCDDRSELCVQHAFAELLILSRTRLLLASPWSSFSEVAARLGGIQAHVAGIDFAADKPEDVAAAHGPQVAAVVAEVQRRRAVKLAKKHVGV